MINFTIGFSFKNVENIKNIYIYICFKKAYLTFIIYFKQTL